MIKYLFSIVFFTSTIALSSPWMPWDFVSNDETNDKAKYIVSKDIKYNKEEANPLFKQRNYNHAKINAYYEGLVNYYSKIENQNNYYGYKSRGYFDYMPGMGNKFPAPR